MLRLMMMLLLPTDDRSLSGSNTPTSSAMVLVYWFLFLSVLIHLYQSIVSYIRVLCLMGVLLLTRVLNWLNVLTCFRELLLCAASLNLSNELFWPFG